jgi:hypothetical protein
LRQHRERTAKSLEQFLEVGMKIHEQKCQHPQRQHEEDGRIQHGARHLRAQFLFARLKIGDLRQHHVQKATRFAGLHHGHVHARENVRRFGHRFRQRHAVNHQIVNSFHFAAAAGVEASEYRMTSARLNDTPAASKLESRRVKFSNALAETRWDWNLNEISPRLLARLGFGLFLGRRAFREADRAQTASFHLAKRVGPARGLQLAFGDGAIGLQCFVAKRGHGRELSCGLRTRRRSFLVR